MSFGQYLEQLTSAGAAMVLTATEVVGDTAARAGNMPLVTYAAYLLLAYQLQRVFKYNGMGLTNAYWNAYTNITHTVIGMVIFREKLSSQQLVGIALVTLGIVLLGRGDPHGRKGEI
jgi:multidrug transporter EmrE-like cation transporter